MKLEKAKLCLDCNEVYDEETCPLCGRNIFWYIAHFLSPKQEDPKCSLTQPS